MKYEKLISMFEDMANRGTLLTGDSVSQQDLLVQIIGTIVKYSMDELSAKERKNFVEVVGSVRKDSDGYYTFENYDENVVFVIDKLLDIDSKNGDKFKITIEKLN